MRNLLRKELRLSASPLTYWFIAFGLMFFLPGYPVLCGAFFVTLGIFQSFQNARECNDILFSALLPVAKKDVVKGKFLFVCLIEACALLLMAIATLLRMTVLSRSAVYLGNALMNANPFALGMGLVLFGSFNLIFVRGFFKTAFRLVPPFIAHCVCTFLTIGAAEVLHHFPGMDALNAFGFDHIGLQGLLLVAGMLAYLCMTLLAYRLSCRYFDKLDL